MTIQRDIWLVETISRGVDLSLIGDLVFWNFEKLVVV